MEDAIVAVVALTIYGELALLAIQGEDDRDRAETVVVLLLCGFIYMFILTVLLSVAV